MTEGVQLGDDGITGQLPATSSTFSVKITTVPAAGVTLHAYAGDTELVITDGVINVPVAATGLTITAQADGHSTTIVSYDVDIDLQVQLRIQLRSNETNVTVDGDSITGTAAETGEYKCYLKSTPADAIKTYKIDDGEPVTVTGTTLLHIPTGEHTIICTGNMTGYVSITKTFTSNVTDPE